MNPAASDSVRFPRLKLSPSDRQREGVVRPDRYDAAMGEVRVNVELTNAMELALVARGQLSPDQCHRINVEAVVDTGAVATVLPQSIVDELGLLAPHQSMATYADGRSEVVLSTEPVLISLLGRQTYEEALVLGDEVLIGQTVLEKLDLWVDCAGQRLVPNPEHPDFPVLKIRRLGKER